MDISARGIFFNDNKMYFMLCLLVFVRISGLTKGNFIEHPSQGNHFEFFPLTLHWVHTFDNIRGCTWLFSHTKLSANEIIIMYGSKEGLETKQPGWELSDINNPCSGGIQKKMSVLADAGFYELRIAADGQTFISDSVAVGIIRQIERSIHVMSNDETYILLPGRDFNKSLDIINSTKVVIKLNENYPAESCSKTHMFGYDNHSYTKDVCNKTFHLELDVNITHIKFSVAVDVVDFSQLVFTLFNQRSRKKVVPLTSFSPDTTETHHSTTHVTIDFLSKEELSMKPDRFKVPLIIAFVLVGVLVLLILGIVLYRYRKNKRAHNSGSTGSQNTQPEDVNKPLIENRDIDTDQLTLKNGTEECEESRQPIVPEHSQQPNDGIRNIEKNAIQGCTQLKQNSTSREQLKSQPQHVDKQIDKKSDSTKNEESRKTPSLEAQTESSFLNDESCKDNKTITNECSELHQDTVAEANINSQIQNVDKCTDEQINSETADNKAPETFTNECAELQKDTEAEAKVNSQPLNVDKCSDEETDIAEYDVPNQALRDNEKQINPEPLTEDNVFGVPSIKHNNLTDNLSLKCNLRQQTQTEEARSNSVSGIDEKHDIKIDQSLDDNIEQRNIQRNAQPNAATTKHHNVPDYTTLRHKSMTGGMGSENHQFKRPFGVACLADKIIVTDTNNHRVKYLDSNLKLQRTFGEKGSGQKQFMEPTGVAVGRDEVFVSDAKNHRIVVLSAQGEYLREFGTKGTGDNDLLGPKAISICDEFLFILESENYRVKIVKLDGTFVSNIGSKGSQRGQFKNKPVGLAVMSPEDGRILVNEVIKCQLNVYTWSGDYLGLFPKSVPKELDESIPNGVAVDPFDNVLITYRNGKLAVYDKTGELITVLNLQGTDQGQLCYPVGVGVNTGERFVIVCDCIDHRVKKFDFDCI